MTGSRLSRRGFIGAAGGAIATIVTTEPIVAQSSTSSDPMRAAEELSQLEVTEHIPALYTFYERMHPDAQVIIPRHVVIAWFREEFQPSGPRPAVATGVTYRDWSWPVTGQMYRDVAEVSFRQEFADGTTVEDDVRLVWHDGAWRWFFGRDRAWVDAQIQRFTQTMNIGFAGEAPLDLHRVPFADDMLSRLPPTIELEHMTAAQGTPAAISPVMPEWASSMDVRQYVDTREPYPVGYAQVFHIVNGMTAATGIRQAVEEYETLPPFTLHAWNLAPDATTPYASFETFGSDAVGMAQNVMWADADGAHVGIISCIDEFGLEAMANALAGA